MYSFKEQMCFLSFHRAKSTRLKPPSQNNNFHFIFEYLKRAIMIRPLIWIKGAKDQRRCRIIIVLQNQDANVRQHRITLLKNANFRACMWPKIRLCLNLYSVENSLTKTLIIDTAVDVMRSKHLNWRRVCDLCIKNL